MFSLHVAEQFEYGLLNRHIECCCWFVGDDYVRIAYQRHSYHHALFLAAADFMRVAVEDLLRAWQKHLFEQFYSPPAGLFMVHILVQPQHFDNLFAAFLHRIQAGHRFLKNHRYMIAPQASHLLFVKRQQISIFLSDPFAPFGRVRLCVPFAPFGRVRLTPLSVLRFPLSVLRSHISALRSQFYLAADRCVFGQQTHNGQTADTLARTRLSYDAQRVPAPQRVADIVNNLASVEGYRQILNLKHNITLFHINLSNNVSNQHTLCR